jgi:pyruvate dehydrogenase E2 component (dihydrolipoamide acetyltransferase)
MADVIRMPLLSDTMTEGKIAAWNKKVGDTVKADDSLADVETDKATMEVVPYVAGTLLYIGLEAGQAAKVNDIIAIIGKPGEDISSLLDTQASAPEKANVVVEQEPKIEIQTSNIELPKELTVIRMPLLSDTMTEGKIVVWNKNVGDKVKADDSLADVETDKATMEVVGYVDGTLLYQGIKAGEAAKINEVIAVVGKEGFDITPYLASLKMSNDSGQMSSKEAIVDTIKDTPKSTEEKPIADIGNKTSTRIKASPLAKQIAKEKGIDLHSIEGSGDGGRIVRRDLESISATPVVVSQALVSNSSNFSSQISFSDTPLTQMRKIIAQRLSDSMFTAPHFYLKTSVEMDTLMDARKLMNAASPVKISINDMMIKACAMSLAKHPVINSSWMVDFIRHNHQINIGTAIALPDGLIVPVIKNANLKSLSQIAFDANDLYTKARNKKIQPAEFTGNTFTISNLGMMDIDEFTAIINPPDACILAVGKIAATPVVKNGAVVIKNIMKLTLSCDHRVVDGAEGALFLQTLKGFLESPVTMLV